ncbi:HDOD domain-containing protein [bacterium]|nr:HDOD domain-containing protein [bacterium]
MDHRKKRILFVAGVTPEIASIKLEFMGRNGGYWDVYLADSGLDALDYLAEYECHAVITDLRLEDMTGVQVLNQVARHQIRAQRVLLADPGDIQSLLRCVGGVHQFLTKPCVARRLELVIDRMQRLDTWLPSLNVQEIAGRLPKLPSPPSSYNELSAELDLPDPRREVVAELLSRDPAMTAKLLQLVNSAAYGEPIDECDPMAAFAGQGLDTIKGLVKLAHQYSHFNAVQNSGFSPLSLWEHSRRVSRLAGWIAGEEGDEELVRVSSTSGLLHDIGKVAIAANLPRKFNEAQFHSRINKISVWEAEQQQFGATHSEVGGWLMCVWGLPIAVVEAVMLHHHPARQNVRRFTPLTAVHLANAFAQSSDLSDAAGRVDMNYLDSLRMRHRLPHWWDVCRGREEVESAGTSAS